MIWDESPRSPVEFACPHCGRVLQQTQGQVVLCDCPKARQAQAEERQRQENWRRQQEEAARTRRRR